MSEEPVRIFGNSALQAQIDSAVAQLPPEKRGVVLGMHLDGSGPTLVVAAKLSTGWSIVGALKKPPKQAIQGQAEVLFSW